MTNGISVAVTGSTGHLASSAIPLLIDKGYRLRVLQYNQEPAIALSGIETVKGSLSDISSLDKLVEGCEVVIHCAARISLNSNSDPLVYETNMKGTINMFNSAIKAGVRRFVHLSSIHAYNQVPSDEILNESSPYCSNRAPCYDRSKRDAEKYVLEQASGKMEVVVLNPTGVVGPFDNKLSLMGKAILDIYNRKVPALIRGGFDFCDVRDVAGAMVTCINKGRNRQSYLLSGKWVSLADMQNIILKIKGYGKGVPVLPSWTGYIGLPFTTLVANIRKQEPLYTKESLYTLIHGNRKISSAKAAEELGYVCRPLHETIADSINWFKQTGHLV
jgi:dihydroflavonol-4-reductase